MGIEYNIDINLFNFLDDLVSFTNEKGEIIDCNDSYLQLLKKKKEDIIGLDEKEILPFEERIDINGNLYFFKLKKENYFKDGKYQFTINVRKNMTKEKKLSTLYKDDKKILKQIANGEELLIILNGIIKSAEKMNSDMMCSILLLDESKEKLFSAAAPSIPEFFTEKINGMQIGEKVGSCGAAVVRRSKVIVEDIQIHENWQLAKRLAAKAGLYACWSQPIFSSKGEVLGTFAMYYSTPKKPTDFDLYVIEDRASLAAIAIEKDFNEIKLQKNLEKEKKQEELLMHKSKQAMMGEMLENIAHQWRQPLSVISTSATGLNLKRELGISDDEFERKALFGINENAQYLSKTIDDFRNYFKSNSLENEFNLRGTFDKTLKLIDVLLKNKNVKITEDIEDINLFSLENELTQVFMNILNNSVDELEKIPAKKRFISIKAYRKNKKAIVKIVDSAGGAPQEIVNRIFEPYFTTKHQAHGTGLGLYMCKEIIEKHMDGSIEARNIQVDFAKHEYTGLEFVIKLPIL